MVAQIQRLDNVTRMLCHLCARSTDAQIVEVPELLGWWRNHQREDAARHAQQRKEEERKAMRQIALDKLTPAERKLLNL